MHDLTAAAAVVAILAAPVAAQDLPPAAQPPATIVMSGEALVRRPPDVAFIAVAVESRSRNSREAQRLNAEAMSAVQKRIADAGVSRDALRTLGVWLEQEFDLSSGRRVPRGFVARNTLEVRVDDVARVGEIADAAVEAGATSLGGIRFDLRDRDAAEREAVRLAVQDARRRAESAAAGAGRAVDRIVKIEDSRSESVPPGRIAFARTEASPVTDVTPGMIEIRSSVTLTVTMR